VKVFSMFGVGTLATVGLLASCATVGNAPNSSIESSFENSLTDRQQPLTDSPGRYAQGATAFNDRDGGHCVLCHQLANSSAPFQGNIGPPLDGVGSRLDAVQIRYRIVDSRRLNPQSLMPAYFSTNNLQQVATEFTDKTVLSATAIEDLVAYLAAQKTPEA
jgi:sulfur-oxidizing protein SoxX